MAISYEGFRTASNVLHGENEPIDPIAMPANVQPDDLVIATCTIASTSRSFVGVASGWNQAPNHPISNSTQQNVYWKIIGASEPDFWFTIDGEGTSTNCGVILDAYRGVDPAAPFVTGWSTATGSNGSVTVAGVSPSLTNTMLVAGLSLNGGSANTYMNDEGMTTTTSEVGGRRTATFYQAWPNAEASGSRTLYQVESTSAATMGYLVALGPGEFPDIPIPVITSAVPLSSTSYRVEWEDGGEPE